MSEKQDNKKGHVDSLHQVPMSNHATHPEQDSAWEERLHPHWEHLDEWSDRHSPHPSAAHIQQALLQAKKRNRIPLVLGDLGIHGNPSPAACLYMLRYSAVEKIEMKEQSD